MAGRIIVGSLGSSKKREAEQLILERMLLARELEADLARRQGGTAARIIQASTPYSAECFTKRIADSFKAIAPSLAAATASFKNLTTAMSKITPPAPSATTTAAPTWQATTLQWLRENHPSYATSTARTTDQRLQRALVKMGYGLAMFEKLGGRMGPDYEAHVAQTVSIWNQQGHDDLRKFLADGGLNAERLRLGVVPEAQVAPDDDADEQIKELHPHAEMSPDRELDAIVEAEELEADPRTGSW